VGLAALIEDGGSRIEDRGSRIEGSTETANERTTHLDNSIPHTFAGAVFPCASDSTSGDVPVREPDAADFGADLRGGGDGAAGAGDVVAGVNLSGGGLHIEGANQLPQPIALDAENEPFDELPQEPESIAPAFAPTFDNWSELWRLEPNGNDADGRPKFRWRLRFAPSKPSRPCGLAPEVASEIVASGPGRGNHAEIRADSERLKHTALHLESELRAGKKRRSPAKKRKRQRKDSDRNSGRNSVPKVRRVVDGDLPDVRGKFVN
jgi:hypothetical protein